MLVQLGAINPAIGVDLRLKSHGKRRTLKCLDGSHKPPAYLSQRVLVCGREDGGGGVANGRAVRVGLSS